jgi:N-acetylmuramic acid 6-phosphate etherase
VEARGHLATEGRNPASAELDRLTTEQAVALFQREDRGIHDALEAARPAVARAVDLIAARLREGGRLIYVGAGTSGRLATLDAAECPPTFQSDPGQVRAVMAGGAAALREAVEGAEDDERAAPRELERLGLTARDVVFGISAGGTTPFVHAALAFARERGAGTVFLACVPVEQAPDAADVSIRVTTGPELVAGSTRLKAGTATKLVLNTVSTLVMTRLGKVHGNLMVDVDTGANAKLLERATRIVRELTGLGPEQAGRLLERAQGRAKVAVAMHALDCDAPAARRALEERGGSLRACLEAAGAPPPSEPA